MAVKVLKTCGDRVLIRRDLPPKQVGSILLAEETVNKERLATAVGTVLEIGDLCWKTAEMRDVQRRTAEGTLVTERAGTPWCKVGDKILYQRYSGMRIPDPNSQDGYVPDLVFVLDRDILCVLEQDEEEVSA
jgi:co-chaperonin GroES (HSP10)